MMHPLLADVTPTWTSTVAVVVLLLNAGMCIGTIGMWRTMLRRQQTEISPQPFAVKIVEEMHDQFASKTAFDLHVKNNTERHAQLFSRIESVKDSVAKELPEMERRINEAGERRATDTHERINEILEAVSELRGQIRKRP